MDADNIEFAADLEPDMVGCDRFEQFVELVRLIRQMKNRKNSTDNHFFLPIIFTAERQTNGNAQTKFRLSN